MLDNALGAALPGGAGGDSGGFVVDDERTGNSPLRVVAVLVVLLGFVLAVGLLGARPAVVTGSATPAPVLTPASPEPEAVLELGTNPLLGPGILLPEVTCELPALRRSPEQLTAFYTAALRCLDAAWQPALAAAGEPFAPPVLTITDGHETACGEAPAEQEATAYYCGADKTLTMPRQRLLDTVGVRQSVHLSVLAHEYAHHVQELSGIMVAAEREMERLGRRDEVVRRLELQANCFAGLFLAAAAGRGSVGGQVARQAADDFRNTVGSDTHGTVENQAAWARKGFGREPVAVCNTFVADEAAVR
ncbi:neutral zinc metallopeptidase [Amycolatopsis suaedae]|uniref:Metalloprotease n=1 Tax=Amycolatopsis suaedae TaxID=2510978 RepID=A0A4Q7J1W0_9PSEU|nr:neutral zinc metallopeptidase [Amycolatopsis suaedae]RZQ59924.1 hypothetical protein EWH70_31325 [Amycolatopsis suaedae]